MLDAGRSPYSEGVGVRSADADRGRTHRKCLDHVGSAADARVEDHRRTSGGFDDCREAIQSRQAAVGLPAAVVRAVDPVDSSASRVGRRRGRRCP